MKKAMRKLEELLEIGGIRKDVILLVISGIALLCSIFDLLPLPFDAAWAAIILCGIPIILEAVIGLVTEFDIKADVLVSLALIASVLIGEDFAAGEVAFIMQLGGLLEELTVARARAGIEKLVHLTPQTARTATQRSRTKLYSRCSLLRRLRLRCLSLLRSLYSLCSSALISSPRMFRRDPFRDNRSAVYYLNIFPERISLKNSEDFLRNDEKNRSYRKDMAG